MGEYEEEKGGGEEQGGGDDCRWGVVFGAGGVEGV